MGHRNRFDDRLPKFFQQHIMHGIPRLLFIHAHDLNHCPVLSSRVGETRQLHAAVPLALLEVDIAEVLFDEAQSPGA